MSEVLFKGFRFERITADYLDEVMGIEVEAYPEPWSRGMFREEIKSPRSYFYLAFQEDKLVGYGGFWLVLDEAHITSVTIRSSSRGQGLGRDLTQFLLKAAMDAGAQVATLEVRASNLTARNLYESEGFRQVGLRKGYYPKSKEDAVVMLKELNATQTGAGDDSLSGSATTV